MHFLIDAPFFAFSLLSYPFNHFFLRALFLSGHRPGPAAFSRRVHQQGLLGPPEVGFGLLVPPVLESGNLETLGGSQTALP